MEATTVVVLERIHNYTVHYDVNIARACGLLQVGGAHYINDEGVRISNTLRVATPRVRFVNYY